MAQGCGMQARCTEQGPGTVSGCSSVCAPSVSVIPADQAAMGPLMMCRLNPYARDAYDGINLNPLETVFVKVKSFLLQAGWPSPVMSQTYDRWSSFEVCSQELLACHMLGRRPFLFCLTLLGSSHACACACQHGLASVPWPSRMHCAA